MRRICWLAFCLMNRIFSKCRAAARGDIVKEFAGRIQSVETRADELPEN